MMRLDLDGLADASREALMSEWRDVVGRPPPKHLSRPLLVKILSHAYQLETVGGYRCCQTNELMNRTFIQVPLPMTGLHTPCTELFDLACKLRAKPVQPVADRFIATSTPRSCRRSSTFHSESGNLT